MRGWGSLVQGRTQGGQAVGTGTWDLGTGTSASRARRKCTSVVCAARSLGSGGGS